MKVSDSPTARSGVVSSGSQQSAQGSKVTATVQGGGELTQGQLLKGLVVEAGAGGRLVLEVEGRLLAAMSRAELQVGREVWLEVKEAGDTPWLVVADKKGAVQEMLKLLLADHAGMGQTLKATDGLAATAAGSPGLAAGDSAVRLLLGLSQALIGEEADPAALIRFLTTTRLAAAEGREQGESVGRLSRLLQEVAGQLKSGGASPKHLSVSPEGGGLVRLGGLLDAFAALNYQPAAQDQAPYFLFPCFFSRQGGWGEWLLSMEQEERQATGRDGSYSLSFYLHMSRIGELHLQVRVSGQQVRGEFAVADSVVLDHLKGELPELTAILEGLGYGPVQFGCREARLSLLHELKETLQERARLRPSAILDITA